MEKDCIKIFKCLADKSRLLIINNLMESPMYVELLAERLNLAPSTVSFHLFVISAIVKDYIFINLVKDLCTFLIWLKSRA